MRILTGILAAALLTGCPETIGQQCPSNSAPIGQYQLVFSPANPRPSDECRYTAADAGADASTPLTQMDAGAQIATLCAGPGDAGAVALTLAVPGRKSRTTDLQDGGAFVFPSHTDPASGTVCNCPVAVDETFTGTLQLPEDGGFALQPDGGIPLVTGITGTLIDRVTSPSPPCLCNVPCSLQYDVQGTRF